MEYKFSIDPFHIKVFLREVHISRDRGPTLVLSPSSIPVLKNLILSAMRIETFPELPKRIEDFPFIIEFTPLRTMVLTKDEPNSSSLAFSFDEGDLLQEVLQSGMAKWLDITAADRGRELPSARTSPADPLVDKLF